MALSAAALALCCAAAAAAETRQQPPPPLRLTVFAHRDHALLRIGLVPKKHNRQVDSVAAWAARCRIVPAAGGAPIWEGNASSSNTAVSVGAGPPPPPLVALSLTARPGETPSVWGMAPGQQALYNASCTVSRTDLSDTSGWREGVTARFGFRDFEAKAGQFLLNGAPIFLRGWYAKCKFAPITAPCLPPQLRFPGAFLSDRACLQEHQPTRPRITCRRLQPLVRRGLPPVYEGI